MDSEKKKPIPRWLRAYKIRHPKRLAFLVAYSVKGTIQAAAKVAEIDRQTHYDWMKADPQYKAAFAEAYEHCGDVLEDEAWRRAVDGVPKGIYRKGFLVGTEQEFSDTMLIFKLKGHKPEKYKDRIQQEHTGDIGLGALFEAMMKQKPK